MTTTMWWVLLGYPDTFEVGKDGFLPRPGQVVKHYREKKMNDKGKAWTQADLAKVLGITDHSVRDMENRDVGLDSYERRKFLSKTLNIPPILFGIMTAHDIAMLVTQQKSPAVISTPLSTGRVLTVNTAEYAQQLVAYWDMHYASNAHSALTGALVNLDALYRELPHGNDKQNIQLLLCEYHQLISRILIDQHIYTDGVAHLDKALSFAEAMLNEELIALTLSRRGREKQKAGQIDEAIADFRRAKEIKKLPSNLTSLILLGAGEVESYRAGSDQGSQDGVMALIEQGGRLIRTAVTEEDPHFMRLHISHYHRHKAAALIKMGRNQDAIRLLDQLQFAADVRQEAIIATLQAQAHFNRANYPDAARFAEYALEIVQTIGSQWIYSEIKKLVGQFQNSPYRDSPDVARLDYLLSTK